MSTEGNKATSAANAKTPAVPEDAREREAPQPVDEGMGVFRGLMLMVLFYVAFGFLIWFAWNAFTQWRGH